jgi:hypothetical protein
MIESLKALAANTTAVYTGVGVVGAGIAWALKKIPNDTIKDKVGGLMYGLGVTCTLGLAKWKITRTFWNKVVEPWVIDFIDNIFVTGIQRFIDGLRSDNK